jgi:hypothetical protein
VPFALTSITRANLPSANSSTVPGTFSVLALGASTVTVLCAIVFFDHVKMPGTNSFAPSGYPRSGIIGWPFAKARS